MELAPHDVLKIEGSQDLISFTPEPEWVKHSLIRAPFVVVRRVSEMNGLVPVGVRGEERNQRFGTFLPYDKIRKQITPEQLVMEKAWQHNERTQHIDALSLLPNIDYIFSKYKLLWGPIGSVGFELASGVPTAKPTSDLDVVIRARKMLSIKTAQQITKELSAISVRVDVQIETPKGAIALVEYAHGKHSILLRTEIGPFLIRREEIWD
jgi:phosphoribosyl-dephospho-CoA transferase